MPSPLRRVLLFAPGAAVTRALAQFETRPPRAEPRMKQSQVEQILKADHEDSTHDAAKIVELAKELQLEIEKNDRHVLSLKAMKLTEQIEKLTKKIRGRMKRF